VSVSLLLAALALLAGLRAAGLFESTAPVTIAVEPGQNVVSVPARATGVNVAVWDGHLRDAGVPDLLRQAGIGLVRYPGGATADVYHWRTNAITPGQDSYVHPANTFAHVLAQVATPADARALVTVNYGSNETGAGGGDPAEAAAWVYYANRLHQQAVRFWEIGNEVYGNGYYGRRWETDLHGDLSPATYARNALAYITAMKAVDPTIKVGLDLVVPGDWPDRLGPQHWNETVLAIAGHAADFVSLHWYAQQAGPTSDSGLLRATEGVSAMIAQVRALLSRYVGAHAAAMTVLLTETNSAGSPADKQTTSVVNGLFLIQDYLAWLQAGAALVAWWDLHNGPQTGGDRPFGDLGLLSSGTGGEPAANTPFPAYTALTLLRPALSLDAVLTRCSASVAAVTAFALQQSATRLSLVLVNTSPTQKYTVTPSVAGVSSITAATASGFGAASPRRTTQRLPVTEGKVSYVMQPYSAVVLALTIPPGQMPPLPTPGTATAGPAAGARPSPTPATTPVTSVTPQPTPPAGGASPRPTVMATQVATATTTATATPTGTETATATPSAISTGTATATSSATSTGTATATSSATSTGTATVTPSGTTTSTVTVAPTGTATATPSDTPTGTVTATATATPSGTPTGTATATPSGGPTATPPATLLTTNTTTPGAAVTVSSVPTGGRA